jgi:hypothetical protein|tara:strand:- start:713 stop:961 length:249 start_codon:yes stop_codon:yes gene_type:complete
MGGSGGIVYTAHTKLGRILCKLDRVAQLDRYGGGCYIAGLSQRGLFRIYIDVSPPGGYISYYTPTSDICQHLKKINLLSTRF